MSTPQPINQVRISLGQLKSQQDVTQLVQHLRNLYNGQINQITGSGAPTMAPTKIGSEYLDTKNKKIYKATGNSTVADWQALN